MTQPGRVRVFIACSIDGFIAGPDGDLSWLPGADPDAQPTDDGSSDETTGLSFEAFLSETGALLMGRGTYDAVRGFGVPWPYGDRPVLVATNRPLDQDPPETAQAITGHISALVSAAREAAGARDVYLDGGSLIGQAADAGLIDELTVTMVPVALGAGHSLFAGLSRRYLLEIVSQRRIAHGMLQLHMRPVR